MMEIQEAFKSEGLQKYASQIEQLDSMIAALEPEDGQKLSAGDKRSAPDDPSPLPKRMRRTDEKTDNDDRSYSKCIS